MSDRVLSAFRERIAADPEARFAVSLDHLAYAKDNHILGTDLVRTFVRSVDTDYLSEPEAAAVSRLRNGMNALTGKATILGGRYGDLAAAVRDAGGSVFEWVTDNEARDTVRQIAGSNRALAERIARRSAA